MEDRIESNWKMQWQPKVPLKGFRACRGFRVWRIKFRKMKWQPGNMEGLGVI